MRQDLCSNPAPSAPAPSEVLVVNNGSGAPLPQHHQQDGEDFGLAGHNRVLITEAHLQAVADTSDNDPNVQRAACLQSRSWPMNMTQASYRSIRIFNALARLTTAHSETMVANFENPINLSTKKDLRKLGTTMTIPDPSRSLEGILNTSTPYAPRDADDLRSRIAAYEADPPGPAPEPPQEKSPEADDRPFDSQKSQSEPPATSQSSAEFPNSQQRSKRDHRAEASSAGPELALLRAEQAERFTEQQRRKVFRSTSHDGRVTASVDGTGQLLALEIDDSLLHGSESLKIGKKIVEATNAAAVESLKEFTPPDWSNL
ncbi:YbaB/EbfC family nucleoid-associated protein [Actinomadura harenae]|nr:YbaB/EbfC family nucleoid-associated protein [Actinomadura harenae]